MPSLRTLDRRLAPRAVAFFAWARKQAPGLVVTSARRTRREQQRLYEASQRGQNNGLPASPPGYSSHEIGLAWDMARLNIDPLQDPELWALGAAWMLVGGVWSGVDPVHFQAGPSMLGGRVARHPRRRRAARSHL